MRRGEGFRIGQFVNQLSLSAVNTLAGVISTVVPDSPHKIFIGGLPNYLNEDQVSCGSQTEAQEQESEDGVLSFRQRSLEDFVTLSHS